MDSPYSKMIDQTFDQLSAVNASLLAERNRLLRSIRALSGLDMATLAAVTPDAMRAVCKARGWLKVSEMCIPGQKSVVGMEVFDNDKAVSGYVIPCVRVPLHPDMVDYPQRVHEWATDLARRHGDVSPAEVLAEALALVEK